MGKPQSGTAPKEPRGAGRRAAFAGGEVWRRIESFIQAGTAIGAFERAVLIGDEDAIAATIPRGLRRGTSLQEFLAMIGEQIPEGMFQGEDEVTAWEKHQGLQGASAGERVLLVLRSPRWREPTPTRQ
jgi:hypothetical protein